jgi:predicted metalloprotease with PDZ domain
MSKHFIILITFFLIASMLSAQSPHISYTLGMPKPGTHIFEIGINFENINDTDIDLILPVWRPGRYLIFDFASGLIEFSANDENNHTLKWEKINKCTWRIHLEKNKHLTVNYKVYSNEFDLRTRGLNEEHGFIDGTSVFMYSEKYRYQPITLKVEPFTGWHVTTGLDNINDNNLEFKAQNYDYFVDCPLEIGIQKDIEFEVAGIKHIISIFGDIKYDKDTLIKDFSQIIKKEIEFWGKVPYSKYVFIIHISKQGGGGTEHINSCVIDMPASAFEERTSYEDFLHIISHEFFHTWNVKQLRPKGLSPYDYTKENYTSELWIAEGGTSYYESLIVLRTGQLSIDDFHKELAKLVERERRRPGNKIQSLAESSFDAWIKFWKGTQQSFNTESSYYAKGANVSLILDLEIRHHTNNAGSLDSVYRKMFERFPLGTGYTNSDFQKVCEEVIEGSLQKFFDDYVYGTKPIDWDKYFSYAGLELVSDDSTTIPAIGLTLYEIGVKLMVSSVITGSSAEDAGLDIGDEIIALNGERVNMDQFNKNIEKAKLGDKIKLSIFRDNKLKEIEMVLKEVKLPNYKIIKVENPSELQKNIYENWLGVNW